MMHPTDQNVTDRTLRIMEAYDCSQQDAEYFLMLRDEGHSRYAASVMSGISDPQE